MEGKSKLVVAVHGGGGGAWEWDTWRPEFEDRGIIFAAIDLEPKDGLYNSTTVEHYVDQIVSFAEKAAATANTNRVDALIGASMGGVLVLKACHHLNPGVVVLVCSCLPFGVPSEREALKECLSDSISASVPTCFPPVMKWTDGNFEDTVACLPGNGATDSEKDRIDKR
jgi:alpha-beta hydrolase superfamily lysophospholipase